MPIFPSHTLLGGFQNALGGAINTLGTAAGGALNSVGDMIAGGIRTGGNILGTGLGAGGNFLQQGLGDLTAQGFWPQNASPEDIAGLQEQISAAQLDPATAQAITEGLQSGRISAADAMSLIEQSKANLSLGQERQEGMLGLGNVEALYGGNLQSRIDRLQGLTSDPLAIRSDAEYGAILRDVEEQAAAGVREAQRQSGARAAARGTGFAGKSIDTTEMARQAGRTSGFQALGSLHGTAQESLDRERSEQNRFVTTLEGARQDLRSSTRQTPLDFSNPFANQLQLRGANLQRRDQPLQQLLGLGQSALGGANQLTGQLVGTTPSLIRAFG